jgi:hypothetical protein
LPIRDRFELFDTVDAATAGQFVPVIESVIESFVESQQFRWQPEHPERLAVAEQFRFVGDAQQFEHTVRISGIRALDDVLTVRQLVFDGRRVGRASARAMATASILLAVQFQLGPARIQRVL